MLSLSTSGTLSLDDQARQTLDNRGLADAGLADVQRIVLAPPAQDLDRALDLHAPADQRIDPPFGRQLVQIGRVLLERGLEPPSVSRSPSATALSSFRDRSSPILVEAVGDVVDDIQPRDVLHASRYAACDCFSLKIATSTLATVTSFLPLDCT